MFHVKHLHRLNNYILTLFSEIFDIILILYFETWIYYEYKSGCKNVKYHKKYNYIGQGIKNRESLCNELSDIKIPCVNL